MALHWQVEPECRKMLAQAGLDSARAFLEISGAETVVQSRTTSTVRRSLDGGSEVFIKTYRFPDRSDRLRGLLRGTLVGPSKARREWDNLGVLPEIGVAVPGRVAYGEERRLGVLHACFLATLGVPGAERCDGILGRGEDPALAAGLGVLAGTMHRAGYRDGSLALRNVLARRSPAGAWELFKLDCPKGRIQGRLSTERCAEDLAVLTAGLRLLCGPSCLDSFFASYGQARGDEFREAIELRSQAVTCAESKLAKEKGRLSETGPSINS